MLNIQNSHSRSDDIEQVQCALIHKVKRDTVMLVKVIDQIGGANLHTPPQLPISPF